MTRITHPSRGAYLRPSESPSRFRRLLVIPELDEEPLAATDSLPDRPRLDRETAAAADDTDDPNTADSRQTPIHAEDEDRRVHPEAFSTARTDSGQHVPRPAGTRQWLRTWVPPARLRWRRPLVVLLGIVVVAGGWYALQENPKLPKAGETELASDPVVTETAGQIERIAEGPLRVNRSAATVGDSSGQTAQQESIFRAPSLTTQPVRRTAPAQSTPDRSDPVGPPTFNGPDGNRVARRQPPGSPAAQSLGPDAAGRRVPPLTAGREMVYEETLRPEHNDLRPEGSVERRRYETTNPETYRDPLYHVPSVADRQPTTTR